MQVPGRCVLSWQYSESDLGIQKQTTCPGTPSAKWGSFHMARGTFSLHRTQVAQAIPGAKDSVVPPHETDALPALGHRCRAISGFGRGADSPPRIFPRSWG